MKSEWNREKESLTWKFTSHFHEGSFAIP